MVASHSKLSHFSNPLVTSLQLSSFQNSSFSPSLSHQLSTYLLTQAAGVLLRLPQPVVATAIVILQRHLVTSSQSATTPITQGPVRDMSVASTYLSAKLSATPLAPRSVINVYAYLKSRGSSPLQLASSSEGSQDHADAMTYYVSEGDYERQRLNLFTHESALLASLGFDIHVALPHTLALTYLSALGTSTATLAKRVIQHLNSSLLSPQLLYLTHQPNVLAVAAIYLAAREVNVKLVEQNWWEVFDVDREALGFCVMAMGSLNGFVEAEKKTWEAHITDVS
jgi:cyclin L